MPERPASPREITTARIIAAGRELGLDRLSISAVAQRLGVTPPALYRHVASRSELEVMVGEDLLASVRLTLPSSSTREFLIGMARTLFSLCVDTPGMAAYLHRDFPRGEQSARLRDESAGELISRGYDPWVAQLLASTVATLSISLSYGEVETAEHARERAAMNPLSASVSQAAELRGVISDLGVVLSAEDRLVLTIGPCVDGLLGATSPCQDLGSTLRALKEEYL